MKFKFRNNYVKLGVTLFIVGAALILFSNSAKNIGDIMAIIPKLVDVCMPFIIGFVIAYLMTPMYNAIIRRIRYHAKKRGHENSKFVKFAKPISMVFTFAFFIAVFSLLMYMVLPELVNTVAELVVTLPATFDNVLAWVQHKAEVYQIWGPIERMVENSNDKMLDWITEKFLPASMTLMDGITTGVMGFLSVVSDILIGVVAAVYMLASKDIFAAQAKKLTYCIFPVEAAEKVKKGADIINRTFMKFISSNLLDGLTVGIITCLFLKAVGWEYSMLIAVIIGVTNLIPFFGPFIGAIPSIALLLTVNAWHALYFGIFVLVLQQVDGNIIKPKLFGEGVGLPSFWVMFSIILGGGLFGFLGMLLAVPVFAVVYQYVSYRMNRKLAKNNMSEDLEEYMNPTFYDMRKPKFEGRVEKIYQKLTKKETNEDNNKETE